MKNILIIIACLALTLLSNYLGYAYGGFSILFSPVLFGVFTWAIMYQTDFKIIRKFFLILVLIILNDILIKLFAAGTHDWEGLIWIMQFQLLGIILSLIIIVYHGFDRQRSRVVSYFIYLLFSSVLLSVHFSVFKTIGMIWTNLPSENKKESIENGLYLSDVSLSETCIVYNQDTIIIKDGWFEKNIKTNHQGIIKNIELTNKINCTLVLDGDLAEHGYLNNINYRLVDKNASGYPYIDKTITLVLDKNTNSFRLGFYRKDLEKIKEVEIKRSLTRAAM